MKTKLKYFTKSHYLLNCLPLLRHFYFFELRSNKKL